MMSITFKVQVYLECRANGMVAYSALFYARKALAHG